MDLQSAYIMSANAKTISLLLVELMETEKTITQCDSPSFRKHPLCIVCIHIVLVSPYLRRCVYTPTIYDMTTTTTTTTAAENDIAVVSASARGERRTISDGGFMGRVFPSKHRKKQ